MQQKLKKTGIVTSVVIIYFFNISELLSFQNVPDVSLSSSAAIINCTDAVWPPTPDYDLFLKKFFERDSGQLHLNLSGNHDVQLLPQFLSDKSDFDIHIYAEDCRINHFTWEHLPDMNVRHVYLARNGIQALDVETLAKLKEIKTKVTLVGNPLMCDCEHKDMYDAIVAIRDLVEDFEAMTCNDGMDFSHCPRNFDEDCYLRSFKHCEQ